MKIKYIILMVSMLSTGFFCSIFGQQTPIFANYSYNTVIINPAHAGFYPDSDITFTNRGSLNQIEGSPKNIGLTFNSSIGTENVGLGAGVYSDQIGVTTATRLFGAYSYKLFFNSNRSRWGAYNSHVLSFGITGGIMLYDENLLALGIQNDPNFENNISTIVPTLGIGALYNREDVYIGVSVPNLLGGSLSSEENINIESPFYLYTGYRFFTSRFEEVMVTPSILLKYVSGAPTQMDFNTKVNYKNIFEIGAGYRTNSSMNFIAGFYITNHLRLLYNYNKTLKNMPINDTHGIVLNIRLGHGFVKK